MYRYGLSYYKMENNVRVPQSGVDIRLLRPGQSWAMGLPLIEVEESGYYECIIEHEDDCGYYEVWDDVVSPSGGFTGKTCYIGQLDSRAIQNAVSFANHIQDGAVIASKIANNSISSNHLADELFTLSKIQHEVQDQNYGKGDVSNNTPATTDDEYITHILQSEYSEEPLVMLSNQCNSHIYIVSVKENNAEVTVILRIGAVHEAQPLEYQIIAFPK